MATSQPTADHSSLYDTDKLPQHLKDWIDGFHPTDPTRPETHSLILHKPTFTIPDMQHALIYARNRVADVLRAYVRAIDLAGTSYRHRIDLHTFMVAYGDNILALPRDCLEEWQWYGEESEMYIFDLQQRASGVKAKTTTRTEHAREPRFRRTIAALCKLRTRIERDNGELRRAILREQDEGRGPEPMVLVLVPQGE
ncbi:hypothetical protein B0A55_08312 [Friedmanniomyces simplex]|uniref:Uncharacterized protein n=1 Tax=Friedmanniomyces simplex TaxID=329884 RepID=A0A4U0WVT3_9PEZI|nr:hypothetical protein B0A55_08312 [Friedmanniomyces simplex]